MQNLQYRKYAQSKERWAVSWQRKLRGNYLVPANCNVVVESGAVTITEETNDTATMTFMIEGGIAGTVCVLRLEVDTSDGQELVDKISFHIV